jgi:CDP-diacylglycerol--serine O-phosphatidyltransferase
VRGSMNQSPVRYLALSNTLSYVSLFCGLGAVMASRELHSWEGAGLLVALSAFADTFDGKFARRFPRTDDDKAFGVQLDSLVDAVSFGVVPVVCLNALIRIESPVTWVIWVGAAGFYVVCALTRLGFYNLHREQSGGFVGLPTTLAGLLWSTLFLAHPSAMITIPLLVGIGLAMISFLPVPRPRGVTMAAYMFWFVCVFALHLILLKGSL